MVALVLLSKTIPEGSINNVVVAVMLPHPARLAVTRSLRSNSKIPSPAATTWIVALAVGTLGRIRKIPLFAAVSVAVNVSVSPVN